MQNNGTMVLDISTNYVLENLPLEAGGECVYRRDTSKGKNFVSQQNSVLLLWTLIIMIQKHWTL